ncbi:hypothetical protein [Polaribacter sargassicola]|uniref:hypothetical protein n=1 Tax=Polaribacter sargassicola TaxID=2836891 RepID=UPI001F23927E|nr:hypothetical protein [Polaribacter sp. DS7-9]MCG1035716.1 hypothetical protein [Polaribacter sp. DS7-9]
MIKKIIFSLLIFTAISAYSQDESISNYKYIIVKDKFDFLKKSDQYQTSSLTKFLLKKKGFEVVLSNEDLPNDLKLGGKCSALEASVEDESNMFTVKSIIVIKNCFGAVLYTSQVGKSKLKDYKKGYHEAIRRAFETMEDFNYSYKPKSETPKTDKIIANKTDKLPAIKNSNKKVKEETKEAKPIEILYAQEKGNGFQLVNSKPEVVFEILKTRKENVFIIKGKDGTLYKNEDKWFAEFYENDKLVKKEYQVKF